MEESSAYLVMRQRRVIQRLTPVEMNTMRNAVRLTRYWWLILHNLNRHIVVIRLVPPEDISLLRNSIFDP